MVAVLNGEDESSCVLEKMELVVFRSYFQRPKDVIFEGLSNEGLVMVVLKNDEEEEESVERSWRIRGLERE